MKTIYNVKALCVVALLGSGCWLRVLQDGCYERKDMNREMTLEFGSMILPCRTLAR